MTVEQENPPEKPDYSYELGCIKGLVRNGNPPLGLIAGITGVISRLGPDTPFDVYVGINKELGGLNSIYSCNYQTQDFMIGAAAYLSEVSGAYFNDGGAIRGSHNTFRPCVEDIDEIGLTYPWIYRNLTVFELMFEFDSPSKKRFQEIMLTMIRPEHLPFEGNPIIARLGKAN